MTVETIVGIAAGSSVAVTALVTAIVIARIVTEPWRRLSDESARRAKAESGRDVALLDVVALRGIVAQKDRTIDAMLFSAGKPARPADGRGTDGLREQLETEDAERAATGAAGGDDPVRPVPRVASTGPVAVGPVVPR